MIEIPPDGSLAEVTMRGKLYHYDGAAIRLCHPTMNNSYVLPVNHSSSIITEIKVIQPPKPEWWPPKNGDVLKETTVSSLVRVLFAIGNVMYEKAGERVGSLSSCIAAMNESNNSFELLFRIKED